MAFRSLILGLLGLVLVAPPGPPVRATCPPESEVVYDATPGSQDWSCIETRGDGTQIRAGWSVTYRPSGSMLSACEFADDVEHGHCSRYDESGAPMSRGSYRHGQRVDYWWFWGVLEVTPEARSDTDRARPREFLEMLLAALDVAEPDVPALAQYLLDVPWDQAHDIRTAPRFCAASACISAALDGTKSILAIQYDPPAEIVVAPEFEVVDQRAAKERKAEQRAASKREADYQTALTKYERAVSRADGTHLVCMDGTRSPSCVCGQNPQGCCSHRGGVSHCPADYPDPPLPPLEP